MTSRVLALAAAVSLTAPAAAAAAVTGPGAATPDGAGGVAPNPGIPSATCFWFGPMGKGRPGSNKAYPDGGALYWGARFRVPPGATLALRGRYPHARYMSVNSYGRVDGVEHAAVDSLQDTRIRPDRGHRNPYRVGADRYAPDRAYTVRMTDSGAGRNELTAPTTNEGAVQELIYRVYLPDRPRDAAPRSLPRPELRLADGRVLRGRAVCAASNDPQRYFPFQTMPPALYRGLVTTPGADPATNPSYEPVRWEKFLNQRLALSIYRLGTPSGGTRTADLALGVVGGFYDNRDVRYAVGPVNSAYGRVLVLRGTLPRTPATGPHVRTMGGGQMRYWSLCQNGSPVETNAIDCLSDEQVRRVADRQGRYTIVVSRRVDRPRTAVPRCGVAWLDFGEQRDDLGRRTGTLLLRNLDARRDFPHSLQQVGPGDVDVLNRRNAGQDRIMGPYQPRGTYTSRAAFERLGCRSGSGARG